MSPVEICRKPLALRSWRGFGLIELLVVIAIMAILAAVALPSFRDLGMRMTVTSHTNDLVAALNTARAEAAKRGTLVGVVGSGNDWSAGGWKVVADANHGGTFDSSDPTLAEYSGTANGYAVKTKVTNGASDAEIAFGPQGALVSPVTAVDVNVCRPDGQAEQSAWIHVAPSGEISSRRNTSSSPAPAC